MIPNPELPPNCDFFKKVFFKKDGRDEWIFDVWSSSDQPLAIRFGFEGFNHKSPWISIVAAVARDGWMTEAHRATLANEFEQVAKAMRLIGEWREWEKNVK
jgi:hypothetical protein